jgi:hypothetical protein
MPTTAELLGLTPQEVNAAAFTASGEGAPGKDIGGVLQTILARKALNPKSNIVSLVTAPQQFVANAPYSTSQVTDPNYGSKIYGSKYNQALQTLQNPNLMSGYLQAGQGATSFRGQALLGNKHPDDIMFSPNGNFYFDKNPAVANQLIQKLGQPSALSIPNAAGPTAPPPVPAASSTSQTIQPQVAPETFAASYGKNLLKTLQSMAAPRDYGGLSGNIGVTPINNNIDQFAQTEQVPTASPNSIIAALMGTNTSKYV